MGEGLFGNLFDLNGDGELDAAEQVAEFLAIDELMDESADDEDDDNGDDGF